ncbi:DUF2247 family protein [Acinetobacter nosocomialis]|uniref:DUF2247 family protein n=1 Tax=Acinetobacter nosocomialis TaxID=106654 RepID=UPI000B3DB251|nr:DUF2247 family protein [Acinetobacter nosocomialis]MBD0446489.1 DUF2247 family protein [Acinetobacter nosocomialis]MBO8208200.1 DUF2247 family protein [Acinetobacter nosocomialis]MBO8216235.1 DUF2247 family protein [Acinetobacter nosocomialis]MBO8224651.1 DUF2247 family protein [Acinetobacter nosocomialis]MBO8250040.1 DUF2247 family protein [Acinetobacter nosocomialis]
MNLYPIPADFINEKVTLSWCDIKWGYENNLITCELPIKKAENIVLTEIYTKAELELSFLIPTESNDISSFIYELCPNFKEDEYETISQKWLYVILSWLWLNRESFEDPLDEVESIYTDFDCPAEMDNFIKYMPPTDGYNPSLYSYAENINRLMKNWENYLQKSALKY